MASAKLQKTFSSAGNMNKWTISLWLKRSKIGVEQIIASCYENNNYQTQIKFETDDQLYFNDENNGNTNGRIVSNTKYRDTSGFYHMVFIWDKDNSTSGDKLRMYVNGERITSFSDTGNAPSASSTWNAANTTQQFGAKATSDYFDGIMTHIHFCDGYAYEPTEFGETDSTTGIWKPKVSPSVTYGTNGYFLKMDNAANMGLDSGGGSNNFTTSGTIIQNKDTPNNVFATWNPLDSYYIGGTGTNVNTTWQTNNSNYSYITSTLGASSGKWYWEVKVSAETGGTSNLLVGVTSTQPVATDRTLGWNPNDVAYRGNGNKKINNSDTSYGNTYAVGNIIGVAMDLDNNKLYFSKDGVWQNSGVPTSGSTGTGAIPLTASASTGLGFYFASISYVDGGQNATYQANFGNGYFGTTAVSSAQNPDDGNGIFEYDVPAGYRALCTKSLNAEEYS